MRKPGMAGTLLMLFASHERANEMEGDFLEEKQWHGSFWFALQVLTTTLFLYWEQLLRSALATLFISIIFSELLFLGIWNFSSVIHFSNDALYFVTFSLVYFLFGMLITILFRHAGTTIAFTTAFTTYMIWLGILLATSLSGSGIPFPVFDSAFLSYLLFGLLLFMIFAIPMLLGSLIIERRRQLAMYRKEILGNYGA